VEWSLGGVAEKLLDPEGKQAKGAKSRGKEPRRWGLAGNARAILLGWFLYEKINTTPVLGDKYRTFIWFHVSACF
jgi:hypothetical protein